MRKVRVIGTLVLVLALGLALALFLLKSKVESPSVGDPTSNPVACTEEALLCPGGSYVSRSGPECRFDACPSQPSYVGTLRQSETGFQLLMKEPEYVLPIEIQISNTLGDFVGQQVRVFGSIEEANIFKVDRLEAVEPALGVIGVGETRNINGVSITLNEIVQDNRCPVDAQCIEAGAITANVSLRTDAASETRNMASDEVPITLDSFKISIISINPPLLVSGAPPKDQYVLTFRVES